MQFADVKPASPDFVRENSTGLFVGVRMFPHDPMLEVPYAVDDAVDLAYLFSLDDRSSLVPPRRVVLALSGRPQKEESQKKLRELREAGARVEDATSDDIRYLLEEQTRHAGTDGLLVLSLATHGFLDDAGDAYILGSASKIGDAETSLQTRTIFDIAGKALRSVIFVDACRDRVGQTSRGAGPDPTTVAPHIRKMPRYEGQAIFYAAAPGQYAYDDDVRQNGVFTGAVLDGLNCSASAPRETVLVESLYRHVEREVRRWIEENKGRKVAAATQISMEGNTRSMPLSQCRRGRCSHVAANDSGITLYDDNTNPLWHKDFGQEVVHAEVVDLDADARCEVVVGLHDRITVLDRDGAPLWDKSGEPMKLGVFATGVLFEKHKSQIVALWKDESTSASQLVTIDSKGDTLSTYEHDGLLQLVAVGRPTNMHSPKIAVADDDSLLLFDPKKISAGPRWQRTLHSGTDAIRDLRIIDANNDSRHDIEVSTKRGKTIFDFDGAILRQKGDVQWMDMPRKRRASVRR